LVDVVVVVVVANERRRGSVHEESGEEVTPLVGSDHLTQWGSSYLLLQVTGQDGHVGGVCTGLKFLLRNALFRW